MMRRVIGRFVTVLLASGWLLFHSEASIQCQRVVRVELGSEGILIRREARDTCSEKTFNRINYVEDGRLSRPSIGKGLGGGYQPVAGVLIHRRVIDALERGIA
jgi:hypothetical protein